jgi:hypothetical protein
MSRRSLGVLLSGLCASACLGGVPVRAEGLLLKTDWGGLERGQVWPLGVGVPLRQGQFRDPAELAIKSTALGLLPARFEARARYPDGSIQWLWADFQAPAEDRFALVAAGARAGPSIEGIKVASAAGRITVRSGLLVLVWDTRYATPVKIRRCTGDCPEETIATGDGQGIYFLDQHGKAAVLGGPGAELDFKIETANKLRVVLRVEGWYVQGGRPAARGVVRYHLYWRQPWLKIEHTFIVTRDNDELWYREIGIRVPLAAGENAVARFGREGSGPYTRKLGKGGDAWAFQEQYPAYYKKQSVCRFGQGRAATETGSVASGWCDLNNGTHGVVVAVKDFAPQFPKELAAGAGGVTVKLWSDRGGMQLDYRPKTLIKDWWGDWFDRLFAGYPLKDVPAKLRSKAAWDDYNPGCVGVAKTHELLVGFYAGPSAESPAPKWAAAFERAPLVCPDPKWTCHVGPRTFWPMAAKGEGGAKYAIIERFISTSLDEYLIGQQMFPFTGWYDWGRLPVLEYEKVPEQNGRVYAQWYRIGIHNLYHYYTYLMTAWARSGDRKYYETATRYGRFLADYHVIQAGGGKANRKRGYFSRGGNTILPIWGTPGLVREAADSETQTGMALEYLFQDNRRLKDTLELVQQAMLAAYALDTRFAGEDPDCTTSGMIGIYRVTRNPVLLARIKEFFHYWTNPNDPAGISAQYYAAFAGSHYTATYKLHRKAKAIVDYIQLIGTEEDRPIGIKAAQALVDLDTRAEREACGYCNLTGAVCGLVYPWQPAPQFREYMQFQVETIRKLFELYERLPPDQRGQSHWLKAVTPAMRQTSYHDRYYFPELRNSKKEPQEVNFNLDKGAVPFMSMPIAIDALEAAGSSQQ